MKQLPSTAGHNLNADKIRILDVYSENQHENHMWVNYDLIDQIIDMCTNQNPLYKIDNQISNHMWVNYD
jgi:hypothetical protein